MIAAAEPNSDELEQIRREIEVDEEEMISLVLKPAATMALLMGLLVVTTATLITVAVVIICR
jgi:hypothetical protein